MRYHGLCLLGDLVGLAIASTVLLSGCLDGWPLQWFLVECFYSKTQFLCLCACDSVCVSWCLFVVGKGEGSWFSSQERGGRGMPGDKSVVESGAMLILEGRGQVMVVIRDARVCKGGNDGEWVAGL